VPAERSIAPPRNVTADRRVTWAARVGVWLVRLLGMTWRFRVTEDESVRRLRAAGQPIIFALWHGQLLPLLYRHRGEGVVVLISEHSDGEIIARIAKAFGFGTVRGSTSRGAARALLELARVLEAGRDLAVTPDGPRGPAKSYAPGVLVVAQRTGAPVIGAVATTTSAWRLKSWDRFLIPKPFARVNVTYTAAQRIDAPNARQAAAEAEAMREAMERAEQRIGV
jgi:lysophospholipid acyltransferase (LPLAT)-like uncharacterized protein